MQTKQHSIWWPRLATFLLWVAAGASLAFWILKWPGMGTKLPAVGVASIGGPAPTDTQAVARLLGMGAAAPALPTPGAASRPEQARWIEAVKNHLHTIEARFPDVSAGRHVVKVWRLDDNAVLEKVSVDMR